MPSKQEMYAQAVASLARILHPPSDVYVCPMCLRPIQNIADLTVEHVPPRSLGGKKLCLTCRPCNSTAGHTVDSAMHSESSFLAFLSADGHRSRVKLDLEGHTLNAEVWQESDVISIRILPRQNNPTVERRFKDRLTDPNADPPEISVDLWGGYKQREADSGYLRAAYLGAFAKFGYQWALTAEMDPIRRQILNPADAVIQNYRIGFGDRMDAMTDGFYLMKQPITALLVRIGKYGILLPWPGMSNATQISNWIEDKKKKGLSRTQTFAILGRWPITCEFILDAVVKPNS